MSRWCPTARAAGAYRSCWNRPRASTARRLDHSAAQQLSGSTTQRLGSSAARHLDGSTARQLDGSTARQLDGSTGARPLARAATGGAGRAQAIGSPTAPRRRCSSGSANPRWISAPKDHLAEGTAWQEIDPDFFQPSFRSQVRG
jgi:hypothetical protein